MGGIAPNDDRQWPGDGKPETRQGDRTERERPDGDGESDDRQDHQGRATQAPALQALAIRREARPDEDESAEADTDGKPTRQERGPHGLQGALIEVAR